MSPPHLGTRPDGGRAVCCFSSRPVGATVRWGISESGWSSTVPPRAQPTVDRPCPARGTNCSATPDPLTERVPLSPTRASLSTRRMPRPNLSPNPPLGQPSAPHSVRSGHSPGRTRFAATNSRFGRVGHPRSSEAESGSSRGSARSPARAGDRGRRATNRRRGPGPGSTQRPSRPARTNRCVLRHFPPSQPDPTHPLGAARRKPATRANPLAPIHHERERRLAGDRDGLLGRQMLRQS